MPEDRGSSRSAFQNQGGESSQACHDRVSVTKAGSTQQHMEIVPTPVAKIRPDKW